MDEMGSCFGNAKSNLGSIRRCVDQSFSDSSSDTSICQSWSDTYGGFHRWEYAPLDGLVETTTKRYIKMDDLGVPYKTPMKTSGNLHISLPNLFR